MDKLAELFKSKWFWIGLISIIVIYLIYSNLDSIKKLFWKDYGDYQEGNQNFLLDIDEFNTTRKKKHANSEKRDLPAVHNGHITVHQNDVKEVLSPKKFTRPALKQENLKLKFCLPYYVDSLQLVLAILFATSYSVGK